MKLAIASVMLLFIGCTDSAKKESLSMSGAYQMKSVSIKSDQLDTSYTNVNQLKIYTGDYMMYANINSPDSVSSFGIGSYTSGADSVTENVIYSAGDSAESSQPATYKLAITNSGNGYSQFIAGMQDNSGQKFDMTEVYESVGTPTTSPLDGAWKLVKRYDIKGTDTTDNTGTQYKTYFAGDCIWGHTWKDSTNKIHTGIGFGKFTMPAPNKVKESMTASTYSEVRGHEFDIDIEMMGTDGFKQTMINPDGSKSVELYEKLK
jgi:hypothetical protein